MNRWLKSRMMVFGMVLCAMAYVPAVVGPNTVLWIPVFGGIAMTTLAILGGKNALDSYKHGPYRGKDAPYPEDER